MQEVYCRLLCGGITLHATNGAYEYIFPGRNNPTAFMSQNTMIYAVYRLGYHSRTTVHGFRATASTILNEHGFMPDVIERQLAHVEINKVRASYNHANDAVVGRLYRQCR